MCYLLHCSEITFRIDVLKRVAKELSVDLKIIGIQDTEQFVPAANGMNPSPIGFLHAFRDADFIITNSFHGTVFAALFEKNWITIPQGNDFSESKNIRQTEFLNMIQCSDRFVSCDFSELVETFNRPIDFEKIDGQLSVFRKKSSNWLLNNLIKDRERNE